MKRLVWLLIGAVIGVLLARRLMRLLRSTTPESVAGASGRAAAAVGSRAAAGLGASVRRLADEVAEFTGVVRENAAEREALLRAAMGVDVETGGLAPDEARRLLEDPTSDITDRRPD